MKRLLHAYKDADPLPRQVLAIVGVWGLLAGLMLVHTLLATKQLHRRVNAITHSVSEIDQETGSIELMQQTNKISSDLLAASQPLPATLEEMRRVTAGLAAKVDSILAGTTQVQSNSQAIEGQVVGAQGTAGEINASVKGIGKSLASILATLPDIAKHANSIDCSSGLSVLSLLTGPGQACNR